MCYSSSFARQKACLPVLLWTFIQILLYVFHVIRKCCRLKLDSELNLANGSDLGIQAIDAWSSGLDETLLVLRELSVLQPVFPTGM